MSPLPTLDRVFRAAMQTGAGGQHSDMAAALAFLMKSGRQLSPEPKYIGPSAVLCRAQPSRASESSGMWKIDPRNGIYERTEKKDRVARAAYGHGMSADNSRGGLITALGRGLERRNTTPVAPTFIHMKRLAPARILKLKTMIPCKSENSARSSSFPLH